MNLMMLYLLMLKATATTFSGQASLPVLRQDLVVTHHLLTDEQLNAAVAAGQMSPGPMGIFVVSIGFFVAGVPGAVAAWLAVITPAFLVIPLLRFAGRRVEHPRIRSALSAAVLSSAGLIVLSAASLAQVTVGTYVTALIAVGAFVALAFGRLPTLGILLGAACCGLTSELVARLRN